MNSLVFLCVLSVLALVEPCIWRKNHIYYSVKGEETIGGISPEIAINCLHRALHIYENTLPAGYYFASTDSNIYEEPDIEISFEKWESNSMKPGLTSVNCTEDDEIAGEIIKTIRHGQIQFNTKFNYLCKHWDSHLDDKAGVNLFTVALKEIGLALGLAENDDPTSIMFRNDDNFDYVAINGTLNKGDSARLDKLYLN